MDKQVYKAIAEVTLKLSKQGISKDRSNQAQGYKFRGIDDVYNALAPFLAESKLCILPNVLDRQVVERINQKGTALFYVTVKVDFAFVSAEDGSEHHVVTYGEAMDSGDKATNKAMSAAYKYAAMQAFCIPTEADNDADAHTHTVIPVSAKSQSQADWDTLSAEQQQELQTVADCIDAEMNQKGADAALVLLREETKEWDATLKVALNSRFDSKTRRALKEAGQPKKAA